MYFASRSWFLISTVVLLLNSYGNIVFAQGPKDFTEWEKMKLGKFRDCPLNVDNRDCSGNAYPVYQERDCSNLNPFAKFDCERLKAQEKMEYEARKEAWKIQCEKDKAATNLQYAAEKADCERLKSMEIAAGKAYEGAISISRQALIDSHVNPIPPDIKADLAPFFSSSLLERVRYRIGAANLNLTLVDWIAFHWNNAAAITFAEVIAFKNDSDVKDRGLWAHELAHVEQYDHAGIDGFAQLYTYQAGLIEDGAAKKADWVCSQLQNRPSPPPCNLGRVK